MDKKLPIVAYTMAMLSSLCFVGGLVLLSDKGGKQDVPTGGFVVDARQESKY